MSEWEKIKLSDVAIRITKGTTPTTEGGKFTSTGINYIKSESISYDGRIDRSAFAYISEETHQKLKRSQLQVDDILFSMAGIFLGKNAIVTSDILPANTNQALAIIRLNKNEVIPRYVHYFLRQQNVIEFVNNISGQSAQPNINMEEIGSIDLVLPPLPEQEAIAEVLSSLDDKIDLLHRNNKTLEQLAETLFRQWFVKEADESWEVSILGKIGKVITGKTPSTKVNNYWGTEIPFITPSDFKNFTKYAFCSERYLTVEGKTSVRNSYLPTGAILVTCIGSDMGKIAITTSPAVTNQQINSLVLHEGISPEYVYQYLKNIYPLLRNLGLGGTTMPIVNKADFENIEIPIPPEGKLIEFDKITSAYNAKSQNNSSQIQTLTSLRDSLLPKLMSGTVRLRN